MGGDIFTYNMQIIYIYIYDMLIHTMHVYIYIDITHYILYFMHT